MSKLKGRARGWQRINAAKPGKDVAKFVPNDSTSEVTSSCQRVGIERGAYCHSNAELA